MALYKKGLLSNVNKCVLRCAENFMFHVLDLASFLESTIVNWSFMIVR